MRKYENATTILMLYNYYTNVNATTILMLVQLLLKENKKKL